MGSMVGLKNRLEPEIKNVAQTEGVAEEFVARGVEAGRIVIPRNPIHSPKACGIGEETALR